LALKAPKLLREQKKPPKLNVILCTQFQLVCCSSSVSCPCVGQSL
jgi:hypothetical protein